MRTANRVPRKKLAGAAVAIYTPGPTEEEASRFGLTLEEATPPPFEVLPDCMVSAEIFIDMCSQWRRAGMAGVVTGLDYAVLPVVFGIRGVSKKLQSQIFDDIRVMEDAAITYMNKK